jgi:hypothetical protein
MLISIVLLDSLAFALVTLAARHSFRIMTSWEPLAATRVQIQLEIESEIAAIQQKWVAGLFLFSTLLYIVGIAVILPTLVPGAMCGTGVIQATHGIGWKALALRLSGLALIYLIRAIDRLNDFNPRAPLSMIHARLSMMATPVLYMAFGYTIRSLWLLDTHEPVSCCTVVYDQLGGVVKAPWLFNIHDGMWVSLFLLGGVGLLFACFFLGRILYKEPVHLAWTILILTSLWVPIAALTLVRVLAAYHYEVLQHHCPWCLLLSEHHHIGFLLFGCLFLIAAEACLSLIIFKIAEQFPQLKKIALKRVHTAAFRTLAATALFIAVAGVPAIIWRLRYGVWIG